MGGRRVDTVDNIITLCWPCHARAHAYKQRYLPLLVALAADAYPGVTAAQLLRWGRRREGPRREP